MVWLLCVLQHTRLWRIRTVYKLVGHTHSHCDRAFSRVKVALLGKTYLSEPVAWLKMSPHFCDCLPDVPVSILCLFLAASKDMAKAIMDSMKSYTLRWNHLSGSLNFDRLRSLLGIDCHNLRNIHDLELFRTDGGIFCRWKQYMSDDAWSKPRLLVPPEYIGIVAKAVPEPIKHEFGQAAKNKFDDFLNKFEMFLVSTNMLGEKEKEGMAWLRKATSQDSGFEFPLRRMISEIEMANNGSAIRALGHSVHEMPVDILYANCPGLFAFVLIVQVPVLVVCDWQELTSLGCLWRVWCLWTQPMGLTMWPLLLRWFVFPWTSWLSSTNMANCPLSWVRCLT